MELEDPQFKTADGSALRLYRDTARNYFLTEREGRPIYDDVIYCEVISPGSRDSTPVFEMIRYPNELGESNEPIYGLKYQELKDYVETYIKDEEIDESMAGTPLKQWPEIPRSLISTLRAQSVFTVDALAALPDTKLSIVGPDGRTWRTKAQAYIESSKDKAYATKLAADLQRAQDDIKVRDEQIEDLSKRLARMEAQLNEGQHSDTSEKEKPKGKGKGLDDIV